MIDIENDVWVWCVGETIRFRYPQAVLANDEFIYAMIEKNPKMIFFFGPSSLADVNWSQESQGV